MGRGRLSILFFLSGALALIYEVLWHRQFSLLFGSAAPATAVVLAAYLGGLGLGSLILGRLASNWRKPLVVYGILEICIGAGALGVAPILSWLSSAYPELVSRFGGRGELFLLVKGVLAFAAIAAPTIAMGGTLPVLAELVDLGKQHLGLRVGWLYVVNTAGAALGALAFPFLLLPGLGMHRTAIACAGLNFLIALAALGMARRGPELVQAAPERARNRHDVRVLPRPLVLAFISGVGTFALQVLWNRAFAQIHENSIYSFGLMVAVFILAIAAGAELARLALKRGMNIRRTLGGAWIGGGMLTLLSPLLFLSLSDQLKYLPASRPWFGLGGMLLPLGAMVIFIPVALFASGMPLLFEDAGRESKRSAGALAGGLLAANLGGSITGALLAGFVLPAALGMWKTASVVGMMYLMAAAWVLFQRRAPRGIGVALAACTGWFALNQDLPRTHLEAAQGERLVALTEGAHGVVAVTERAGSRRLKLNNHYVLGGTSATGDERMQAHIPLLLHARPATAAFLGYGTGITAGGALLHPGLEVTAVELVPEVVDLAGRFFAEANLGFASNRMTRLVVDDARNFLRGSREKFDLIVGDLVVPWRPGEAGLYSVEHFAAARDSLTEKGMCCVWVPLFQLEEEAFGIILRTFLSQFGRAFIWRGDFSPTEPAIALIGGRDERKLSDPKVISNRLAQLAPDPFNPQLRYPSAFWMHLIGVIEKDNADLAERRINSEDRPWLELRGKPIRDRTGQEGGFVGRELQKWEERVREGSRDTLLPVLPRDAAAGWDAGALLIEFTLLLQEGRQTEIRAVQNRIRELVGAEAFESIFGRGP